MQKLVFLVILVGEWKLHWFSRKGVLQTRNSSLLPCALLQFSHKFTSPKNDVRILYRPKLYEAKLNVSYTSVTCFGGQCLAMHTDFFQWLASRPVSSCKSWNPNQLLCQVHCHVNIVSCPTRSSLLLSFWYLQWLQESIQKTKKQSKEGHHLTHLSPHLPSTRKVVGSSVAATVLRTLLLLIFAKKRLVKYSNVTSVRKYSTLKWSLRATNKP